MKNVILLTTLFIAVNFNSKAQEASDIFKASDFEYIYYGIDYSHAKFIGDFSQFGDAGTASMTTIKSEYFDRWNAVVENESEKYDIAGALRKEKLKYKTNFSSKINSKTAIEEMEADYCDEFTREDIEGFVKGYDLPDEAGVGIIFITEYLNKNRENAGVHFVIFNIATKQVLIHERYAESAGGFGLRNYWIRPFYEAINSASEDYKKWKRELGG